MFTYCDMMLPFPSDTVSTWVLDSLMSESPIVEKRNRQVQRQSLGILNDGFQEWQLLTGIFFCRGLRVKYLYSTVEFWDPDRVVPVAPHRTNKEEDLMEGYRHACTIKTTDLGLVSESLSFRHGFGWF